MAGAGYKLFNTGDVLTAQQVNEYLMQQSVMSFANAAARTTALSAVLAEGMVSYLQDTNVVEIYTGASWVSLDDPNAIQNSIVDAKGDLISATADNTPARLASSGVNGDVLQVDTSTATGLKWGAAGGGKVKQIINATTTTSTTIASTTPTDTTITATITPTSASNKILVIVTAHYYAQRTSATECMIGGRLMRGATQIANFDNEFDITQVTGATAVYRRGNIPITWLDSPATTSATTYKVQGNVGNTASGGSCTFQYNSIPSVITLLEVEA